MPEEHLVLEDLHRGTVLSYLTHPIISGSRFSSLVQKKKTFQDINKAQNRTSSTFWDKDPNFMLLNMSGNTPFFLHKSTVCKDVAC